MMDLARIPPQPKPGLIHVVIDIPKGSKHKYEFDKALHTFVLDRVLYSSVQYPLNYGFIPNTLADDGDPLDAMVLMDSPVFPGCVIKALPIGMLEMLDSGDHDEKILCVSANDPRYAPIKSLDAVPSHVLDEIAEFFRTYKSLEGKKTEILGWQPFEKAMPLIEKCINAG
jgi:inorganic pyrophosphatase